MKSVVKETTNQTVGNGPEGDIRLSVCSPVGKKS